MIELIDYYYYYSRARVLDTKELCLVLSVTVRRWTYTELTEIKWSSVNWCVRFEHHVSIAVKQHLKRTPHNIIINKSDGVVGARKYANKLNAIDFDHTQWCDSMHERVCL